MRNFAILFTILAAAALAVPALAGDDILDAIDQARKSYQDGNYTAAKQSLDLASQLVGQKNAESFAAMLPAALPGWKAEKVETAAVGAAMFGASSASRRYSSPDGHDVSVRITGDGSAVMHWMDAGTPHEMVTMFHMDKEQLMATHYCSAHNQPRFQAVPSATANPVVFEFKDGTNIRPGDGHMSRLVITVIDADHHDEEWGFEQAGKLQTGTFHMTRVKSGATQP